MATLCTTACSTSTAPNPMSRFVFGGGRCHNFKNDKGASEDTEESPEGCVGEGKENKGN